LTPKERIAFDLWPDLDAQRADRDFKVALNALVTALEPDRRPRSESRYVRRQGMAYGLAPGGYHVDADQFAELITTGARIEGTNPEAAVSSYRSAIDLYQGDYLPEALYQDWASAERERLLTLYLSTASRLAELLLAAGADQEAIALAEAVLGRDRCWEEAYRVLMRAYAGRGNRPQVIRTYHRCVSALGDELDLPPMPETTRIFQEMRE
jgi:two-component SAPR family response regulator